MRHAYVDSIPITEGLTLHERAAADRGGHGRHGVGHPAAQPGPAAPDLRRRQGADPRPDGPVLRRASATTSRSTSTPGAMKKKLVRAGGRDGRQQERDRADPRRAQGQRDLQPDHPAGQRRLRARLQRVPRRTPAAATRRPPRRCSRRPDIRTAWRSRCSTSTSDPGPRVAQALQSSLNAGGFKVTLVPVTQTDYYGKYLTQPSTAKRGVWDIALPGYIPDWFGNNGRSIVQPLFTNPGLARPTGTATTIRPRTRSSTRR